MFRRAQKGVRSSAKRTRKFFVDTDNRWLMLGFIGILLMTSFALPSFNVARVADGIECTRLTHPPGGNQRSLLAIESEEQTLGLELKFLNEGIDSAGDPLVAEGESIVVRVIFDNQDMGPIYLYYRENEEVIQPFNKSTPPNNIAGIIFTLEYLDQPSGNPFRNDPGRLAFPPKTSYQLEDVYVLQSGHRCSLDFEFTRGQMARMNLTPGKYQLRVYYYNTSSGVAQHAIDATATPMFDDQGVWTGIAESQAIRFTVEGESAAG